MEKQVIPTSESPRVTIDANGNLRLRGIDEQEIIAKTDTSNDLSIEVDGDEYKITCHSDASIRVPVAARVVVYVYGDANIKNLEGPLNITHCSGNMYLRNVGPVRLDEVNGDLDAKHIEGDFTLQSVRGNATIRAVDGALTMDQPVQGDLKMADIEGDIVARTNSNATIRLDPLPDQSYSINAGGDLICRLAEDASAVIHITKASEARVKLNEAGLRDTVPVPYDLTLGDGEATIELAAIGNVILTSQPVDWEMQHFGAEMGDMGEDLDAVAQELSQQITQQVEEQLSVLEQQMETLANSLAASGLSREASDRISQRAREASARATARAQEKMQRAQEKMQRKLEVIQRRTEARAREAERRAERQTHRHERRSWGFEWPTPPAPPEPPGADVTDEERLMILRMLSEKKITAEEADSLLAALEGK